MTMTARSVAVSVGVDSVPLFPHPRNGKDHSVELSKTKTRRSCLLHLDSREVEPALTETDLTTLKKEDLVRQPFFEGSAPAIWSFLG